MKNINTHLQTEMSDAIFPLPSPHIQKLRPVEEILAAEGHLLMTTHLT